MWNKTLFILLFTFSTLLSWSQGDYYKENSLRDKYFRAGISMKLSLIPHRTLLFPEETINSSFYKEHFGIAGEPSAIERGTASFQIGGNAARIVTSKNKNTAFEFGFDFGYQNSGEISDQISKSITTVDTTYTTAQISVNYNLHELYTGGYALVKTNDNFINIYIGLGLTAYTSVGSADVIHSFEENTLLTYKTPVASYTRLNPYIPFGFEVPFTQDEKGLFLKLMGSVRSEVHKDNFQPNRFFLTAGIQLQYQF
jgi:hypothetical protein